MKIVFTTVCLLFAVIGAALIIAGAVSSKAVKKSSRVNAKIVDFVVKTHGQSNRNLMETYSYPIYEYYDGGEFRRYTSSVSSMPRKPIGTEATLYISEDGRVRERSYFKVMYLVGGGLAAFGAIFAVIGLLFMN